MWIAPNTSVLIPTMHMRPSSHTYSPRRTPRRLFSNHHQTMSLTAFPSTHSPSPPRRPGLFQDPPSPTPSISTCRKATRFKAPPSRSCLPPSMTSGTPYPAQPVYSMLHIHVLGAPHAASSNRHSATRFVARSVPSSPASPQSTFDPRAFPPLQAQPLCPQAHMCARCVVSAAASPCPLNMSDRFCPSILSSSRGADPRRRQR